MHKFTSSLVLGLFLAVASLAFAAPPLAKSSVPVALVRANGALLTKAGASPSANDAGYSLEPKFPPNECFCQPGWVCCQGVCCVCNLLNVLMFLYLNGGACSSMAIIAVESAKRRG